MCQNLQTALTGTDGLSVINASKIFLELKMLSTLFSEKITSLEVVNYILSKKLEYLFPNSLIALKILLTMPVTVASGERSFSKLKLIKDYLRSTMTQERLTNLATIAIEREIVEKLNYDQLINSFAKLKARKVNF